MITPPSVAKKTSFAPNIEGRKGFSLVEEVMALGIFTMAIVPVIGLLGSGMQISQASIEQSALSAILQ
jgi:Tfp pilus assembly protein PilV